MQYPNRVTLLSIKILKTLKKFFPDLQYIKLFISMPFWSPISPFIDAQTFLLLIVSFYNDYNFAWSYLTLKTYKNNKGSSLKLLLSTSFTLRNILLEIEKH